MMERPSGLATIGRSTILLIASAAAAAGLLALELGTLRIAETVFQSTAATLFSIALWWPLRTQPRAWLVVAAVIALHLTALAILPWDIRPASNGEGTASLIIDLLAILGLSTLVERHTRPPVS